jgi:hypothetical protein
MSIKGLIGTVLDTAVKIFLIIVVVTYTYKYAILAYDFGYRIFAEKAVSTEETAKAISISVSEEASVMEIGTVLEEKGIIRDARLFYVQELLSSYHGKIKSGIYELSSDMTPREMLAVMSAEISETEDGEEEDDVPSSETESPEQESEDGGEGETGEGSGEAGAETEDGEAGTE